jgi:hypothetical protein
VPPGDDLGDIELLPVRTLAFAVRDPYGAPVPGAIAVADDRSGLRSEPTDAAGLSSLEGLLRDTTTMSVRAFRFFPQQVTLPPDVPAESVAANGPAAPAVIPSVSSPSGASMNGNPAPRVDSESSHVAPPFVVVMQSCPSLDVLVTLQDGSAARDVIVVVGAKQELFASLPGLGASPSFLPDDEVSTLIASDSSGASIPGSDAGVPHMGGWMAFRPADDGSASLSSLLPGVPFQLSVWSGHGELCWGPQSLVMQPGERREKHVEIERAPVDLVVSVRDEQGKPLQDVSVSTKNGERDDSSNAMTDARGLAILSDVYGDRVDLDISKEGYANQLLRGVVVPVGDSPVPVVMKPELQVRLFIHDSRGRAVPAESVWVMQGEQSIGDYTEVPPWPGAGAPSAPDENTTTDGAHFLLTGLAPGDVTLVAQVAGRRFEQPHATTVPDAEIVVPDPGSLRVHWNYTLDEEHDHFLSVHVAGSRPWVGILHQLSGEEVSEKSVSIGTVVSGAFEVALLHDWNSTKRCSSVANVTIAPDTTTEVELVAP